jgi:hypothetical protein
MGHDLLFNLITILILYYFLTLLDDDLYVFTTRTIVICWLFFLYWLWF